MLYGSIYATPQTVLRRYAERRDAGQLAPDEVAPAPLYRALMQMEIVERAPGEEPGAEGPRRYPFIMSVGTPDGADDIVEQSWDLSRFTQNPVAFLNHNTWGLPIGRWENVRVDGGVLRGEFVPSEAHDLARTVRAMLDEKNLRCASVGFIPGEMTDRSKYPTDHPLFGKRGYVYRNNHLIECSVVSVPMHPGATMEERAAAPAPAPAPLTETKSATPPDDLPALDALTQTMRAFSDLFPVSVS